ncbi:MAG: T9SS C-terminal target domain-containing protein [Calditrichaeota bacterium]|nr:MAG: T9SS C-terminal target domain-containing protein [Calditrichota bacterium]
MRKMLFTWVALLILFSVSDGLGDYICNVQMPPSPVALLVGEQININFDYFTTSPGGVRIFVRPISNNSTSPGYGAHGSPLYPVGNGSGSGWFTINSGKIVVDQVRIQMYNADQSQLILEAFIPVVYHFSTHSIYDIHISPISPTSIPLTQNVNITFKYKTDEPTGVRIFARPITGGTTSPGYGAHGSPLYPVGNGNGDGFFNIGSGNVTVDHIRFQMYNADQSQLLLEFFVPVEFHYAANSISNVKFIPIPPAAMLLEQNVTLTFDYVTDEAGGVRIFARPITGGGLTPGYGAHGSGIYPVGAGSGTGSFNIGSGDVVVDHVRLQMLNADQTNLLFETFVPVHFNYANHSIKDLVFSPPFPAFLTFNQDVNVSFGYNTGEPGGVRIFARPITLGDLTPNYGAHGSPLYPTGSGVGAGSFQIMSGNAVVDHVRFRMSNENQSVQLLEMFVPVNYHFGSPLPTSASEKFDRTTQVYSLEQNYPNPFNSSTTLEFSLPKSSFVSIKVYDLLGREAAEILAEERPAGPHKITWDAGTLASGLYIYRIEAEKFIQAKKFILMR